MKSFIAYRHEQLDPRIQRDALPCAFNGFDNRWLSIGNDC